QQVHLAVHDRGPGFCASWWDPDSDGAQPDGSDDAIPHGARYGLTLVRALAASCGGYVHPAGGKVIWAALPASNPAPPVIDLRSGEAHLHAGGRRHTDPALHVTTAGLVRHTVLVTGVRR